jgi:hypothetical protein
MSTHTAPPRSFREVLTCPPLLLAPSKWHQSRFLLISPERDRGDHALESLRPHKGTFRHLCSSAEYKAKDHQGSTQSKDPNQIKDQKGLMVHVLHLLPALTSQLRIPSKPFCSEHPELLVHPKVDVSAINKLPPVYQAGQV